MLVTRKNDTALTPASTRRGFLRIGGMTLFSAGFCLGGKAVAFGQENTRIAAGSPARPSETKLMRSTFTPYLTQYFLININGENVYLQLLQINDLKNVSISKTALRKQDSPAFKARIQEECFSLLFASSSQTLLWQEAWKLIHPTLGTIEIFLVPVDRPVGSLHYYEAVFNRLLS